MFWEHTYGQSRQQPNDASQAPADVDAALHALREGAVNADELGGEQQAQLQAIVEQEEKSTRQLPFFWGTLVKMLGIGMSGFYIYAAGTLPRQSSGSGACMCSSPLFSFLFSIRPSPIKAVLVDM
ncbi:MAG: hypothetical protein R2867_07110 [Caldilineaceae bacterium]